ncbi:hypothetical protein ABZ281_43250 [Streptomyces sp. NPDC006265]|uniref:hypothetical protein n=1 Tax=Streptomyces sp. NPDC006265 TaxID=3156740 RepID=UPI0033A264DE
MPIEGSIPLIPAANLGTTVTTSLVALTFIGNRTEFRRALGVSTVHDFSNWLAPLIFFPTPHVSSTLGPLFTIVIDAALILVAVRYLGKPLKLLMVGRARDILVKAVGRNPYLAMATGMGCSSPRASPASPPRTGGSSPSTSAPSSSHCPPS